MKIGKYNLSVNLLIGILIAAFLAISLLLRIGLPYPKIISGDWIKFASIDAYYWMRLVDNQAFNFPHLTSFDPFFIYPNGHHIGGTLFFVWFQAFIIWIIGLGSPTQHMVDVIGICFPPVMAALTVIPVYFIGKTLFNKWAGLLAAALTAVFPGEFIGRTLLGSNDTPVAEILFTTTALAFLILAIKTASQRQLTFNHLIKRQREVITRPLVYSLLAGIFLGFYLNTWMGGALFVFIISLYLIFQFIIDHLRGKSSEYLGIVGVITFLVTLIIFLPFSPAREISFALIIAVLIPLVLSLGSMLMARKGWKPVFYPVSLLVLAGALLGIVYAVLPGIFNALWSEFSFVFLPSGSTAATTLEMQPFLYPQGSFSTAVAWGNFTTSFFLLPDWPVPGFAIISLVILFWVYIKRHHDERHWLLFLTWALVMLIATLSQRRFAYYLVINIALLSGYLSWQAIWLAGFKQLAARQKERDTALQATKHQGKAKRRQRESRGISIYQINGTLAIIVVFFFVMFPNVMKAKDVAAAVSFAPSDGWQDSLVWLRENTPEPLGTPDAYYGLYDVPRGEPYEYPDTAYGVTSWWDYGYWLSRTAHRLPNTNPSQSPDPIKKVASLFLSEDEAAARQGMADLDSRYLVIDYATCTSKFWAMVNWAGEDQEEYTESFYLPYNNNYVPVTFYHIGYYKTLAVRLYNFDGQASTEEKPLVVSYDEVKDNSGGVYRLIDDIQEYTSYQEAIDYIEGQTSGNYVIVSSDPLIAPVPVEAVPDFKLIHSSRFTVATSEAIPEVKIFEYQGP